MPVLMKVGTTLRISPFYVDETYQRQFMTTGLSAITYQLPSTLIFHRYLPNYTLAFEGENAIEGNCQKKESHSRLVLRGMVLKMKICYSLESQPSHNTSDKLCRSQLHKNLTRLH